MKRYTGKLCCDLSKSIEDNKLKIENLIKRGLTGLNAPKGQVTSFEKSIEMYNAGISKDEIKAWVWYKRTTKSVNDAKYIKIWKDYVIPLGNTKENIKKAKEKLTNYAFEDRHPLMILNENSPQWWNAYLEFFEQTVRYGNRYKNVWEEIEKPVVSITKKTKPKSQPKVKSVVNKKDVDFHTTDYVLIRRFYTTIKKLKVEFRPLQLLFQAFQKAAMERKVRVTSETADLFTKVNKKITSYFEQVAKTQNGIEISIKDIDFFEEIQNYVNNSQVNKAIALMRRFISMQGSKPEKEKVEKLLANIQSAIDKKTIQKDNRLFDHLEKAKTELLDYLSHSKQPVRVNPQGLSIPFEIEMDGQKRAYYRRNNEEIEFEIYKYHDGAHDQLKVEAVWFSDSTIKQYYLDNFEDIDQQVIDYKLSKPSKPVKKEYKKINFLDKIKTVKKTPTPQKKSKPVKPTRKAKPGLKGVESTEEIEETIDIDQLDEPTPIVVEIPVELVPVVEKVEPTPEKSNIKSKKIKGLNNVADAMQTQTQNPTYQIGGAIKDLLGNIEIKPIHSVAITLDAEQGAGKTRFMFQFANEFAKNGYKVLIDSNEEHPESQVFKSKIEDYLEPSAQKNIYLIGDLPDGFDTLKSYIDQFDVILIDSWNKIKELSPNVDFDRDLRKAYNGKLFFTIFQRTQDGKMRGGSNAQFDGDIILKANKGVNFTENYIYADKNRYQSQDINSIHYYIASQTIQNPQDVVEETVQF